MSVQRQGAQYLVVGAFNTVFGYGTFALLHALLSDQVHYLLIVLISWTINVLEAFVAYRYLVFQVRGQVLLDLARFSLVYVGALAFNLAVLPILVDGFGIGVLVGQAITLVLTVIASFFAHRTFSFRRPPSAARDAP